MKNVNLVNFETTKHFLKIDIYQKFDTKNITMQNKGLIKVFAILFGLVSLYQLSFTYISNNVEEDAKTFATTKYAASEPDKRNSAQASYLDSIGNIPVVSVGPIEIDYNTAKGKELNKGLDLKGGINVILQVSVKDILKLSLIHI